MKATEYVSELVTKYPRIREIWLIGSRANGSATADSDWDYLAFADEETFIRLKSDPQINRDGVDLMVVRDGVNFASPWTDGNRQKQGTLAKTGGGWDWKRCSPTRATYRATKLDNSGVQRVKTQCAFRVFPPEATV